MLIVIHTMLLYSKLINCISEVTCFVLAFGYFMYPHFIVECKAAVIKFIVSQAISFLLGMRTSAIY